MLGCKIRNDVVGAALVGLALNPQAKQLDAINDSFASLAAAPGPQHSLQAEFGHLIGEMGNLTFLYPGAAEARSEIAQPPQTSAPAAAEHGSNAVSLTPDQQKALISAMEHAVARADSNVTVVVDPLKATQLRSMGFEVGDTLTLQNYLDACYHRRDLLRQSGQPDQTIGDMIGAALEELRSRSVMDVLKGTLLEDLEHAGVFAGYDELSIYYVVPPSDGNFVSRPNFSATISRADGNRVVICQSNGLANGQRWAIGTYTDSQIDAAMNLDNPRIKAALVDYFETERLRYFKPDEVRISDEQNRAFVEGRLRELMKLPEGVIVEVGFDHIFRKPNRNGGACSVYVGPDSPGFEAAFVVKAAWSKHETSQLTEITRWRR